MQSKVTDRLIEVLRKPELRTFYKWFVAFALMVAMFMLAVNEGVIKMMAESDISRLSVLITVLFFIFSVFTGYIAFTSNAKDKRFGIVKFGKNQLFTLGILGTVIGLIHMTNNVLTGSDVQNIIVGLKDGLATALFTTAAGLVASLLLHIQIYILQYNYEK